MTHLNDPSFIPGTKLQFNWSANSLSALKKCPRYYQLTKIEGWQGKGNEHLRFGILYAEALELWDRLLVQGLPWEEAELMVLWSTLCKCEYPRWESEHRFKNRDTLVRSVIWYMETYHDDPMKTLVLAEGSPAVELDFQFEIDLECIEGQNFVLSGRIDKAVTFGDYVYVLDRKTTGSTLGGYYFDQYSPHNQMSQYTLASKVVYGMPVQGVVIDAAQTAVGFTAFSRGITMRSNGQLEEWLNDFRVWMEVAKLYVKLDHWPMNEESCGNYGGCAFRDICRKDPIVRQKFLETDFTQRAFT